MGLILLVEDEQGAAALLRRYIELAPREDFRDILDAIDQFLFFDSRKKMPG